MAGGHNLPVRHVNNILAPREKSVVHVDGRCLRSGLLRNRRDFSQLAPAQFGGPLYEETEVYVVALGRYALVLGKDGNNGHEDYYRVTFQVDQNDFEAWAQATAWAAESFR